MRKKTFYIAIVFVVFSLISCEKLLINEKANLGSNTIVYNELQTFISENYIYLDSNGVNWDSLCEVNRSYVSDNMSEDEFFFFCGELLKNLKDGHVALHSENNTIHSRYDYTNGAVHMFDIRLVYNSYLSGSALEFYRYDHPYNYAILKENIAYLYFETFLSDKGNIDDIISHFIASEVKGLIIDLRDNGGGSTATLHDLAGKFTLEEKQVGYMRLKSGPASNDKTDFLPVSVLPAKPYFDKPVVLLTDVYSFSASNFMAQYFKAYSNVRQIGEKTGGGGGAAYEYLLSNGWELEATANEFFTLDHKYIEKGVEPDIAVSYSLADIEKGIDNMLERAIFEIENW